jgi:hypothetical protein
MVSMHAVVYASAMELVGMCNTSLQASEVGIDFLNRAKQAIMEIKVEPECVKEARVKIDEKDIVQEVSAPPRVRSRGRPKESRLKSVIETVIAKKRKRYAKAEKKQAAVLVEVKKQLAVHVEVKRRSSRLASSTTEAGQHAAPSSVSRKCRLCGGKGHYRSTCHLKSKPA